jgi:hypothetical protein
MPSGLSIRIIAAPSSMPQRASRCSLLPTVDQEQNDNIQRQQKRRIIQVLIEGS